jgi:hypothetical protein
MLFCIFTVFKTSYFENISSSVLVFGLASVSIFQLMLTELRSEMLTSLIDEGHGSANSYGTSGTGGGAAGPTRRPEGFEGSSPNASPIYNVLKNWHF